MLEFIWKAFKASIVYLHGGSQYDVISKIKGIKWKINEENPKAPPGVQLPIEI